MTITMHRSLMDLQPSELENIVTDVPLPAAIYQHLFLIMQDPDVSSTVAADLIAQDQVLSDKILHLLNAAFHSRGQQITTISRAVVILGFRAVRSAVLALSVMDYFRDEGATSGVEMTDFWVHSIATATACKVLAEHAQIAQREEAFVAGLLHDTGKLIEKRYFADDFEDVCLAAQEQHLSWYDCERVLFQVHHASIGRSVFNAWNFPETVIEAVHLHHEPEKAVTAPYLAALTHVGDFIAYQMRLGAPGAYPPSECSAASLKLLGLDLPQTVELHEKIRAKLNYSMDLLKLVE